MAIKAIVFDLDGTLADSSGCIVKAAHFTQEKLGLPPASEASIRQRIGQPLGPMLSALFNVEGPLLEVAVSQYSSAYRRMASTEEKCFDGVLPMLARLKNAGFELAIATGKSQAGAEAATERMGLAPWFDTIHGIVPGTPGKPHPAVLMRAIAALERPAEDCIMVGDTTFDLDLAQAISVRTVAVSWGVHSSALLKSRQPTYFSKQFSDLESWLFANQ